MRLQARSDFVYAFVLSMLGAACGGRTGTQTQASCAQGGCAMPAMETKSPAQPSAATSAGREACRGYINQSTLSDSPHGLCAILLAASEMEAR